MVTLNFKLKYALGACYIPPSSNINTYIILSGDYNLTGTRFYNNANGLKYGGARSQKPSIIFEYYLIAFPH